MFNKEKTNGLDGNQPRWITVRYKMLGIFSIMLALLVMFQTGNYFLTHQSVQDLKEFYGSALANTETLELQLLLCNKLDALDNYILFPDESHRDQLLYADKAFVKRVEELKDLRLAAGASGQAALLDRIKSRDAAHNREIGRIASPAQAGHNGAVVADMSKLETIEKELFSAIKSILSEIGGEWPKMEDMHARPRLADTLISYFNPVVKAGLDIHTEANELSDYTRLRDLALERSIASRRFLITGQEKYVAEFNNSGNELVNDLDLEILSQGKNGAATASFEDAKTSNERISAAFDRAVLSYRSGDRRKASAAVLASFMDEEMLSTAVDENIDKEKSHVTSAFAALTPVMNYALSLSKIMLIYIMLVAVLMSVIIYAAVSRMVRPIVNLDGAARKIAQGDWTQRVEVRSRDEIGRMARSFNMMTDNLEKAETEILRNQLELSALYDVARAIARTIDLEQLLTEILETITRIEVFNLERKGAIFMVEGDRMNIASHIGESPAFDQCSEIKTGDCLCGLAAERGEIIISENSSKDEKHTTTLPHVHPHGHIIVPLKAMDKVVGVLCLYLPSGVAIDEDNKTLLYILGAQIGVAIENSKLYEETKSLSLRDALTGLANRRLMDIMLEKSFARAQRHGSPFSCIMLDIDYFKKYNDTHGHPAGDSLLKRVAEILANEVRAIDLVVRYGGEEFFVLLPDVKSSEAQQAAERIRKAVEAGTDVTVSLGVSSYYRGIQVQEDIIRKADEALYQAKQLGRNRVEASVTLPRRACG